MNEGEIPTSIAGNLTDTDGDGIVTFRDLNSQANADYATNLNGNSYVDGGDLLDDPAWEDGMDQDGNGRTDDLVGWDFRNDDNDPQPKNRNGHGTNASQFVGGMGNMVLAGLA